MTRAIRPEATPAPAPMPVDRKAWFRQIDISNFINAYYELRDIESLPDIKRVLIVGPGQGLGTVVLAWRGYRVTTIDIDPTFRPDCLGSVHRMPFADRAFDAVIASHVLEHLPEPYLDRSLAELARIARYALVYLPVHGRHAQLRIKPGVRGFDWAMIVDYFNIFERPDGISPRYTGGQHFWELGLRGFRVRDVLERMRDRFDIICHYRNQDWLPSHNFVLSAR